VCRPYEEIVDKYVIGKTNEVVVHIRKEVKAGVQHFIVMPVGIDYEFLNFFF
jgi:hypothetical protein